MSTIQIYFLLLYYLGTGSMHLFILFYFPIWSAEFSMDKKLYFTLRKKLKILSQINISQGCLS